MLRHFDLIKEWNKKGAAIQHQLATTVSKKVNFAVKWNIRKLGTNISHKGVADDERKMLADWHGSSLHCQPGHLQFFWLPKTEIKVLDVSGAITSTVTGSIMGVCCVLHCRPGLCKGWGWLPFHSWLRGYSAPARLPSGVGERELPRQTPPRPPWADPASGAPHRTCDAAPTHTDKHPHRPFEMITALRRRRDHLEGVFLQIQSEAVQLSCRVLLTELHPQLSQGLIANLSLFQRTCHRTQGPNVFNSTGKTFSLVCWEKVQQSNPYPSCPPFHHPSFSLPTKKNKIKEKVNTWFYNIAWCKPIKNVNAKVFLPDSGNTCRGSRPSDCSSLSGSRQRGHIPWGQSRIWPVWVRPSLVHLPVKNRENTSKHLGH